MGVENKPGIAAKVFKALAEKNVDVDMIVQSIRSVGEPKTDLIFTIALDDVVLAREVLKELQQLLISKLLILTKIWQKYPSLVLVCWVNLA